MFNMKNILLISPIYPGPGVASNATPVVHYFAKEWVKLGYNVRVIHCPSNFPTPILWGAKLFHATLESMFNVSIRTHKLKEIEYKIDEVTVLRFPLQKFKPHGRYKTKHIKLAAEKATRWCQKENFSPDVIIGHWVNPCAEIMESLKSHYNVPTCLVMHDAGADFDTIYKNEWQKMIANIDIIGYRSDAIKRKFEAKFGVHDKWFYCYSGIPEELCDYNVTEKSFFNISKFIFVGMLIPRKHPITLLNALRESNITNYHLYYIGKGKQQEDIKKLINSDALLANKVSLVGRIPRLEIKKYLAEADVFAMISKNETFGLVYLEAMAAGCITIASRDEGFDGIIKDGFNGFLCEAGNKEELTSIINKINCMTPIERRLISDNARATAIQMTDKMVAKKYLDDLQQHISQ